ncbi:hypothetical protein CPLU01_00155 [Colletotrichum plurivorum]|uniref:Uncharacterized protein n=1 Tax=Colletotrichum plurivorum TaxID=2175906 RepID=A0A8H6NT29_9PEZI|nr:hypothetical protein CPLU01_00155 [Colletotrichum plurivorum]
MNILHTNRAAEGAASKAPFLEKHTVVLVSSGVSTSLRTMVRDSNVESLWPTSNSHSTNRITAAYDPPSVEVGDHGRWNPETQADQ